MNKNIDFKYNPGFKDDADLSRDFVVRHRELELLVSLIKSNTNAQINRHVLLIGSRGMGKTSLARRLAVEIRQDMNLKQDWYAIVFGEESYSISTVGEFWLECIYHLSDQKENNYLSDTYEKLRLVKDDDLLREQALGIIIEHAKKDRKRFIIIVENFNDILDSQLNDDDAWALRHTLQTVPDIMIVATATTQFSHITNIDKAFFEQFKLHFMKPLSLKDCLRLWLHVTGANLKDNEIRPIQILTGGNPRLLRIIAEFAHEKIFNKMVSNLSFLVDQYTDYFKSQLESLPMQERKVFVALLELWDPSSTKNVADIARVQVSTASAQLNRLESRGAVIREGKTLILWQASERLFNIYYLMRRRGSPASRVQALVRFMSVYYGREQLVEGATALAEEACRLSSNNLTDHYNVFTDLVKQLDLKSRVKLLEQLPEQFFQLPEIPEELIILLNGKELRAKFAINQNKKSNKNRPNSAENIKLQQISDHLKAGFTEEAVKEAKDLVERSGGAGWALFALAGTQFAAHDLNAAEDTCRLVIAKNANIALGWRLLVRIMLAAGSKGQVAIDAAKRLIEIEPDRAFSWISLGRALLDARAPTLEAREALQKAVEIEPDNEEALRHLGRAYIREKEYDLAKSVLTKATGKKEDNYLSLLDLARLIKFHFNDVGEAERILERAIALRPDRYRPVIMLADLLRKDRNKFEKLKVLLENSIEHNSKSPEPRVAYAALLDEHGETSQAEIQLRQACNVANESAFPWHYMGRFFTFHNRNLDEAEVVLKKALDISPEIGEIWADLANLYDKDPNKSELAKDAYENAIRLSPNSCSSHHIFGKFNQKRGNFEIAYDLFKKALKINKNCTCAIESLAESAIEKKDLVGEVEIILKDFVVTNPNLWRAHYLLGRVFASNDQMMLAKNSFIEALRLEGVSAKIWPDLLYVIVQAEKNDAIIEKEIDFLLRNFAKNASSMNAIAWELNQNYGDRFTDYALNMSQKAVDLDGDNWDFRHTLAACLYKSKRYLESINVLKTLINFDNDIQLSELIRLSIDIARSGHSLDLLKMFDDYKGSKDIVAPIVLALRQFNGINKPAAKELIEVSRDIRNEMEKDK